MKSNFRMKSVNGLICRLSNIMANVTKAIKLGRNYEHIFFNMFFKALKYIHSQ